MIAELVKEDKNYTYKLKSNSQVIIVSNHYTTKRSAVRAFQRFSRSAKLGRIVVCNEEECYHVEIVDGNNRVLAESVNLGNSSRVLRLRHWITTKSLILNDIETKKMRTYIQNIGEIQLKEPLTVEIEKDEDYVVSIRNLNLFAYGDDLELVLKELKEELIDLYNDLFSGKYKLAKPAQEMKSYLEKLQK